MSPSAADPASRELRILAALSYVPGLCVLTLARAESDPYARHHGRQALVLLFLELVAAIAFAILDPTLGRVPLLGGFLTGLLKMTIGLTLLGLSALGAARAAMGETYRLPFIASYADRLAL